jgi:hypothetical protein
MANENWTRASIVSSALAETSKGVAASLPDPADPTKRKGWERLLDYFHKAAPGIWNDDDITKVTETFPIGAESSPCGRSKQVGFLGQVHGVAVKESR